MARDFRQGKIWSLDYRVDWRRIREGYITFRRDEWVDPNGHLGESTASVTDNNCTLSTASSIAPLKGHSVVAIGRTIMLMVIWVLTILCVVQCTTQSHSMHEEVSTCQLVRNVKVVTMIWAMHDKPKRGILQFIPEAVREKLKMKWDSTVADSAIHFTYIWDERYSIGSASKRFKDSADVVILLDVFSFSRGKTYRAPASFKSYYLRQDIKCKVKCEVFVEGKRKAKKKYEIYDDRPIFLAHLDMSEDGMLELESWGDDQMAQCIGTVVELALGEL